MYELFDIMLIKYLILLYGILYTRPELMKKIFQYGKVSIENTKKGSNEEYLPKLNNIVHF